MKSLLYNSAFFRLGFSILLLIVGAYQFVVNVPSERAFAKALLVAGLVGHAYFFLTYFLMKKKDTSDKT